MILASTLLGNSQRLDGGAMFGNAPRALWSRWLTPDDQNRITFACRALLVEQQGCRTLFETGIGAFFEPELKERYGVVEPGHVLLDSLARLGLGHGDVDRIVLSHLHFDHAGGLLSPYRNGRPIELAFQRAEIVVGRAAFERAERPHPRDRASFIPGLTDLLRASGRLRLVDGTTQASALLGPHFSFLETNGHTPGMLHATVHGESAHLLFCADLVPGRAWVHLPITMGYDRHAERLVDEKTELMSHAAAQETMLVYTHDLEVAASRVVVGNGNRYQPSEAVGDFSRWNLDTDRLPVTIDEAS